MTELKLFVWQGFLPDYSDGLAFAIAESEEQARLLVIARVGYDAGDWGHLTVVAIDSPIAFAVVGGG